MDKKLQYLVSRPGPLTNLETVLLRQGFALVFLWRRDPSGDVETLAGWHSELQGWQTVIFPLSAAEAPKTLPANKPLDPLSESELMRDVTAGSSTAIAMVAELIKWYSRRERETELVRTEGGKKRGKIISEQAAEVAKKIAPLPHLTSGQVEQKLAAKGVQISDRTVRRHRQKKPG